MRFTDCDRKKIDAYFWKKVNLFIIAHTFFFKKNFYILIYTLIHLKTDLGSLRITIQCKDQWEHD